MPQHAAIGQPAGKFKSKPVDGTQIVTWVIGSGLLLLIVTGSVATLVEGEYTFKQWLSLITSGVAQGSVYALIALGYTMVYGVLGLINFAHGEVFMSGAFSAYFLADFLHRHQLVGMQFVEVAPGEPALLNTHPVLSLLAIFLLSATVSTVVAVSLERIAYRPLRATPRLVVLITAIGASFFLQYTFRGFFGSGVKAYPDFDIMQGKWMLIAGSGDATGTESLGTIAQTGFGIDKKLVVVFISALLMLGLLYLFIQKTKAGRAIRAVSEDRDTAALMGIDVDRTITITFATGGFMAGIAGVLYALIYQQVNFYMGFVPGIKAFTAAVLGGVGNLPGAAVGGLLLGILESVGPSLFLKGLGIPSVNQLKNVIAFTVLVLILIFRPTGILGERLATRRV